MSFTITEVDLDAGYVVVSTGFPDGTNGTLTIDIVSAATAEDNTELELANNLRQVIASHISILFPPPSPRPALLLEMVGRTYGEEVV
jgi:hypothetical protein